MKIAFIILAHKNPEQVARLINSLQSSNALFFLHIDKRVSILPFKEAINKLSFPNIKYVKQENSAWGKYGLVQATLNALEDIIHSPYKPEYAVLLSGLDYPLVSTSFISNFFKQNYGKNFLTYFPLSDQHTPNWMSKINAYNFNLFGKGFAYPSPKPLRSFKRQLLDFFLSIQFPKQRVFPSYLRPYAGSQWWCITRDAAAYIVGFHKKHPDFLEYHKYTHIPDEIFFQSILLGSDNDSILQSLVNDNLKYIEWGRPGPRPAVFNRNDLDLLLNSGKLFARKFDMYIDSEILDLIDKKRQSDI